MTNIYIVTQGAYSAYGIKGAFLDLRKAQKFCDYLNECGPVDMAEIETWGEGHVPDKKYYTLCSRTGSIEVDNVDSEFCTDVNDSLGVVSRCFAGWADENTPKYTMYVTVEAKDSKHAIKIAADLFREYKALH